MAWMTVKGPRAVSMVKLRWPNLSKSSTGLAGGPTLTTRVLPRTVGCRMLNFSSGWPALSGRTSCNWCFETKVRRSSSTTKMIERPPVWFTTALLPSARPEVSLKRPFSTRPSLR